MKPPTVDLLTRAIHILRPHNDMQPVIAFLGHTGALVIQDGRPKGKRSVKVTLALGGKGASSFYLDASLLKRAEGSEGG